MNLSRCVVVGLAALGAFLLIPSPAFGGQGEVAGTTWTGEPGITETVQEIMRREALVSAPDSSVLRETRPEREVELERRLNAFSPRVSQWPPAAGSSSALESLLSPQTIGVSFTAMKASPTASESGFIPPDSMGDIGPTQILAIANGRIRVFSRTGVLGALNATTDVFFASVRGTSGTSDPHIRYDRLTGRWFVVMINVASTNNRVLIAVSSGPTITGTSTFTFFQFTGPAGTDAGRFGDYPTLGVDRFALYIGIDMFATTLADTSAFVVNKGNLISGTLTATAFRGLTGGLNEGPFAPQGVDNDDPQATEGYFIGVDVGIYGQLDIRRVSNPGGVPTMSGNILLTVPTTSGPLDQVAQASAPLDALSDQLFAAAIHKNKITGASTLWTAQNIAVDATGVGSTVGDRNGSRWYEIGNLTSTPTLIQSGTLFDPAAANPRGYWMDSVVQSGQGHMALGCSYAGAAEYAGVAVAGRLRTAPLGAIQAVTIAVAGTGPYNQPDTAGRNRWGDYSQTEVDPNDDMTVWTFQEYANTVVPADLPGNWGVRVVQLIAPPPATPSAVSPVFVARNTASATVTVMGTSVSGSEFFDPGPDVGGPGYANHITGSAGGGVSVNSITFDSPTQLTLGISTVGATCSTKDVTITNPDGQARTGAALFTTIPPPPAASNNGTICTGQILQLTASSTIPGATFQWTGPNGFSSTEQNPVIASATTAASGAYSVTITVGGCVSSPSTTNATVNSSAAPGEIGNVRFTSTTTLHWDAAGGSGTTSDIARGLVNELPVGSGASETCLASAVSASSTTDMTAPPMGDSFWYLVRGRNPECGAGPYGFESNGAPELTTVCP